MFDRLSHGRSDAAVEFLQLVIAGHIDEAYQKHVDMLGTHHNPFFPAGFPALQKAMADNHAQFPDKKLMVKHTLCDGDHVAVHSHLVPKPGDAGMVVVHLFRFQGDRIVEFWDCGQPIPDDCPNRDGAF